MNPLFVCVNYESFMSVCVNYIHLIKNMIAKCSSGCEKHVITEKHKHLVYSSQQANKTSLADEAQGCQKYQIDTKI